MRKKKKAKKIDQLMKKRKKMMRQIFSELEMKWKVLWALSSVALILIIIGAVFKPEQFLLFIIGAFFEISVPFSFYMYVEMTRIESIEEHFPDFLRDIAEFKRAGVTLSRSIQNASFNDYGQLTPEVNRMALELSWGVPFNDAMEKLTHRVDSKMIDRAVSIITASQEAGGEVTTILETISQDLRKLKELEAERKSKLSIYTLTIYSIYLLLLFIIIILTESLVPAIPKMQAAGELLGGSMGSITELKFRTLLYHVSLIEAFFAGLISGDMGEGNLASGIKHSIILVMITLLAFQLVPPQTAQHKIADTMLDIPPTAGLSGRAIDGITEISESFNKADIIEEVRLLAKERNNEQLKGINEDELTLLVLTCGPCNQGELSITDSEVEVIKPSVMKYSVAYAKDHYEVTFSDST